tara:strand:- start:471 stop:758 length:288 start_codon:yes stop_codon:yes gene_type:complete
MTIDKRHMQILTVSKNLLSEELMADAVMIAITRRKGNSTETFVVSDGNLHTLRGVAEYVYGKFCEDPDLEEEDDEDEEAETQEDEDTEGDDDGDK